MTYTGPERRIVPRMVDSFTRVKVAAGPKTSICKIHNISMGGVCLDEVGLGLWRGMRVELRFMIPFENGITKIHLRHGTVVWVKNGLTGVTIDTIPHIAPR